MYELDYSYIQKIEELNENLLKKIYCAEIGFSIFLFFFLKNVVLLNVKIFNIIKNLILFFHFYLYIIVF